MVTSYYKEQAIAPIGLHYEVTVEGQPVLTEFLRAYGNGGCLKRVKTFFGLSEALIKEVEYEFGVKVDPSREYYLIKIRGEEAEIYAKNENCTMYALSELTEYVEEKISTSLIFSNAKCNFRCLKVYLPAAERLDYFKRLIDYIAKLRFNAVMIEVGGAMEYKRHPEINEAWVRYADQFRNEYGKSVKIQNAFSFEKNSIHWENGGGYFLPQESVKDLVDYCKKKGLEVIPETPLLSHSDYILYGHKELAERQEDPFPDTYCPSNDAVYKLVFELLDEVIEVFQPKIINIGHDEWYSIGICEKCREKDPVDLFCGDILKIYSYLKEKGIRTAMWGDKLLNCTGKTGICWGGSKLKRYVDNDPQKPVRQVIPATHRAIEKLPKDIIIVNWYWMINNGYDDEFLSRGYEMVYGNFFGSKFENWENRIANAGGFIISNWGMLEEYHLQRNGLFFEMIYSYLMVWDKNFAETSFRDNVVKCFDIAYHNKNDKSLKTGRYLEITHTTDALIEHLPFEDGNVINYRNDLLGKYQIDYLEGGHDEVPVCYGINIGNVGMSFERKEHELYSCSQFNPHLVETVNTCNVEEKQRKLFYRFVIPLKKGKTPKRVEYSAMREDKVYTERIRCVMDGKEVFL